MESLKNYLLIFLFLTTLIQGFFLYTKHKSSEEFQLKYNQLMQQAQGLQKEIDKLKKEADNIVVPDLKEDEVVNYWKEYLK